MRKFSKYIVLYIAIGLAVIAGIGTLFVCGMAKAADDVKLDMLGMDLTTFIYAKDSATGEYVEFDRVYDDENRVWVEFDKIPENMVNAFVAIEDERFFTHNGFDIKRLIGAAADYMSKGNEAYGASTITQQLVKNLSGDDDVKLQRKLQEIYRAIRLEQTYSKEEILEFYLNTIYLSRQCNGIQAASRRYFNKNVGDLSLAQIASIAGITQFPSRFDPISNPENNKKKQELVLSKMRELGYITKDEYDEAVAEKLEFCKEDLSGNIGSTKTYFADSVISEVLEDLQEAGYQKQVALKMIYSGGLKIYSSVDMDVQNAIEEVYNDSTNFPAVGGDEMLQSAMVVIDPQTGHVVGMSGGRGEVNSRMTLNRATQTLRQPGSSIKPLAVYAPAIEYGVVQPYTIIVDEPINIDGWTPKNSGNSFSGAVTVKSAVARSLNIPAVKVLQSLSLESSFDFLTNNLGITSLVDKRETNSKVYSDKTYSALALGGLTDGVSVIEMAGAYAAFQNGGIYKKPTTYVRVCDFEDNVILEGEAENMRAMSAETADTMTDILCGVVSGGTGTGAAISNMDTAGKTGTTDENKDRWFVGYTPYYVGAVWVGYDTPKSLYGMSGNPALSVWKKVMDKAHKNLTPRKFEKHEESRDGLVKICKVSGKLATPLCALDIRGSQVEYKEFKNSDAPTEYCTMHKEYYLCYSSGDRAHSGCGQRRRVSALGEQDSTHKFEDGYITTKYCTYHSHYNDDDREVTYSICTDSGLLAGANCPAGSVKEVTTKAGEKPSATCSLAHGASRTRQQGGTEAQSGNKSPNPVIQQNPDTPEVEILIE